MDAKTAAEVLLHYFRRFESLEAQCWDLWEMGAKVSTFFRSIGLFGPLGPSGAKIFCCNHLKWIVQGLNYQK